MIPVMHFNIPVGSSGGNPSGGNGIVESTFAAPVLSWEIEKKFNVGVDLGFFDNRIDITADYFFNRREDILIQRKIVPKHWDSGLIHGRILVLWIIRAWTEVLP